MLFAELSGTNVTADKRVDVSNASVSLQVVSDYLVPVPSLHVTWSLLDWTGAIVASHTSTNPIPGLSAVTVLSPTLLTHLLNGADATRTVLVVSASGTLSNGTHVTAVTELYLTPFRDMVFPATVPSVNVTVSSVAGSASEVELVVVADSVVPLLTLAVGVGGYFDDSSFLALPHQPVSLQFHGWSPVVLTTFVEDLTVTSPARAVQVHKSSQG